MATIFTTPMAIGRCREELGKAQGPGQNGRLAAKRRIFLLRGNYFHRLVFIKGSTKPRTNQRDSQATSLYPNPELKF